MAWVCMMRICGSGLSFSTPKGSGACISAAMSAAVCRVLFLMLPAPQQRTFHRCLGVVFLDDSARTFGPGVVTQKLHKIAFDAACRGGGFG